MNDETLLIISQILTQIIAFLIFAWILKRFAWGPILGLIDERRDRIAREFEETDRLRDEAERLRIDYEARIREIEQEARDRIQQAVNEGRHVAQEIRQNAHDEAREITNKAKANIALEVDKARLQLKEDMAAVVLGTLERILRRRIDRSEHDRLIGNFIENVGKSDRA